MKNPAEVARGYLTLGKIKTEQTAVRLLLLGMLAGAFIALAGAAATFGNVYVGKVAGAALDVVSTEPIRADNPLLKAKNCIITPHISWAPKESRQRIMDITVDNVKAFLNGAPQNVVNK